METKKLNLEYENLCFRYKKFMSGENTIKFSTDDLEILFDKIKELEKININNEIVIYQLNNNRKEEIEKLKNQYKNCYYLKEKYKNELDQIKSKALIPKRKMQQITEEQIKEIKNLKSNGLSYSKIESITKWSKYTISRVLNGHYDK